MTPTNEELYRMIIELQQLIRRHNHDGIETDKLTYASMKRLGTERQVLTSHGTTADASFENLPGVSPSASASASQSPSASRSPSASLSPSSSPSPSV